MRKFLLFSLLVLCGALAFGGTLIYRNRNGEKKRVSNLKILSIDGSKMVIKINEGTKTIALSQVLKYYDTNIKTGGEFDDDTAEYDIRLGEGKISSDKQHSNQRTFSISYDVFRKQGEKSQSGLRAPYFYLFVLTSSDEGQRGMFSYSYPAQAKVSMKNYDEAKMMEKVLTLNRPYFYSSDANRLGRSSGPKLMGGGKVATFQLSNLKNGRIVAWYLVAWSKDSISATKEWRDNSYRLSKTWWIR